METRPRGKAGENLRGKAEGSGAEQTNDETYLEDDEMEMNRTKRNLEYFKLWLRFNVSERVGADELQEKIGWIDDAINDLNRLMIMEEC